QQACQAHLVLFFFSSRRRHTRSKRDWSSDVCSSDLIEPSNATNKKVTYESDSDEVATVNTSGLVTAIGEGKATITVKTVDGNHRSEERRVGKECRYLWMEE